jgi:hypothetical protein
MASDPLISILQGANHQGKFVRLSHIGGATLAVNAVMLNSSLPNLNKNTEVVPVVRKMK